MPHSGNEFVKKIALPLSQNSGPAPGNTWGNLHGVAVNPSKVFLRQSLLLLGILVTLNINSGRVIHFRNLSPIPTPFRCSIKVKFVSCKKIVVQFDPAKPITVFPRILRFRFAGNREFTRGGP